MLKYALLIALLLSGCATPYQPSGYAGGYQSRRISENTFSVSFKGNGFTPSQRANDFALLRAAEVAREYNFRYFSILGTDDTSSFDQVTTSRTTYTSGTVTPYGGFTATSYSTPSTMNIYKPGSLIVIQCFDAPPSGSHAGRWFEAAQIISELKGKYGLLKK